MKLSTLKSLAVSAVVAALFVTAQVEHAVAAPERAITATESGPVARWADRALARMEGWISRMRNKLGGHNSSSMAACGEMMAGNGMMLGMGGMMGNMHGAQPNQQWREQAQ